MDYISRDDVLRKLIEGDGDDEFTEGYNFAVNEYREKIKAMPAADVQPLSVVAEHIKNRLYETAFNTDEPIASHAIEDMAGRIDFWINELKDGDTNG